MSYKQGQPLLLAFHHFLVWIGFRWAGEPHCFPPSVFQKNVPRVLYRAFHLNPALPLGLKRLCISLACGGLGTPHIYPGTFHIYPRTYSMDGCCCSCGGMGIRHSLPPGLVSLYYVPACGQPPMPTGEPLWPLRRPHHAGLPSSWTQIRTSVGRPAGG